MNVRVFLLDDHEVVRRGVRELLEQHDDIEVVGEAGTAEEGLARIGPARPDVAVIDMRLPDGNGVEVCREVRSRDASINCLILTSFADDEALFDSIMAGAAGYLLKQIKGTDLVDAVRAGGRGPIAPRPRDHRHVCSSVCATAPRKTSASAASPTRNARSSISSPRASRTARSPSGCSSPRRP